MRRSIEIIRRFARSATDSIRRRFASLARHVASVNRHWIAHAILSASASIADSRRSRRRDWPAGTPARATRRRPSPGPAGTVTNQGTFNHSGAGTLDLNDSFGSGGPALNNAGNVGVASGVLRVGHGNSTGNYVVASGAVTLVTLSGNSPGTYPAQFSLEAFSRFQKKRTSRLVIFVPSDQE